MPGVDFIKKIDPSESIFDELFNWLNYLTRRTKSNNILGRSFVTRLPAPMTVFAPIVTPGKGSLPHRARRFFNRYRQIVLGFLGEVLVIADESRHKV